MPQLVLEQRLRLLSEDPLDEERNLVDESAVLPPPIPPEGAVLAPQDVGQLQTPQRTLQPVSLHWKPQLVQSAERLLQGEAAVPDRGVDEDAVEPAPLLVRTR